MSLAYLYALIRAAGADGAPVPVALGGVGAAAVVIQPTPIDGVAVVVSHIESGEVAPSRRNLMAHSKVLDAIGPGAILPIRFGMVVERGALPKLLARSAAAIVDLLGRLEGRIEASVRVAWDWRTTLDQIVATDPNLKADRAWVARTGNYGDRIRIGEELADRLALKRAEILAIVEAGLCPFAVDHRSSVLDSDEFVCETAFLLEHGQTQAFEDRLTALDAELGGRFTFRLVMPLPPYSFAELRLE